VPFRPSRRLGEARSLPAPRRARGERGKGVRHLPNGQASVRRRIPIPPKFRSVQQRNTARFELKDAGGCEPVHGSILCVRSCWASTSGWRRDTRERQRAARRASPARGRVGSGMMGDTTTRTGQSRFPGRPLRLRPARGGRAFPSAPLPRRRLLPARSGRSPDDAAHRKWAKRCAQLVLLRASGRIADAMEAHLRWAQTPLGYLASPDLPDHGLS
jgi:hypothetical protein